MGTSEDWQERLEWLDDWHPDWDLDRLFLPQATVAAAFAGQGFRITDRVQGTASPRPSPPSYPGAPLA